MRTWSLAFFIGTFLFTQLSALPPFWFGIVLGIIGLILSLTPIFPSLRAQRSNPERLSTKHHSGLLRRKLLAMTAFFIMVKAFSKIVTSINSKIFAQCIQLISSIFLGFSWALIYSYLFIFSSSLPHSLENQLITVQGTVTSIPLKKTTGINFEFKTTHVNNSPLTLKITLNWHGKIPPLKIGEQWQLNVKLKRPRGLANPGGFNYEAWLLPQKIQATGYVSPKGPNTVISSASSSWIFSEFRQSLNEKITAHLKDNPVEGIIRALVLGIRDGITPKQWQFFQATGTSHLIAISGLHIGLIAGFCFIFLQWLWRRSARLCLICPASQTGALAAIIGAFMYAALAGFSVPTQRALIMVITFMITLWFKQLFMTWTSWCLALLIVVLLDPLASLSAGFWLSFGAVAVILFSTQYRTIIKIDAATEKYQREFSVQKTCDQSKDTKILKQKKWLIQFKQWLKNQRIHWAIFIGLFPLTLWFFQQSSLIAIPANLIAIPLVSFLIVPLSMLGAAFSFLALGKYLLLFAAYLLQLLEWPLTWMAQLSFSQWFLSIHHQWHLIAFSLGALLMIAPKGWPGRWLGILGIFPLLSFTSPTPKPGELWITVLDIGQGLAVVLRTQHHSMLYDTGLKFSPNSDSGSHIIAPYLRKHHISILDKVMISHPDMDHRGGLESILRTFPVHKLYVNSKHPKENIAETKNIPKQQCIAGQQWQWDGVQFIVLHPPHDYAISKDNDHCCVLKITAGNKSLLLVGDIEKSAEKYLIDAYGSQLKADILVAPHHGSKTSSTLRFVETVSPRYVIFSTGYLNRYRFPNSDVIDRYKKTGAILLNTPDTGALTFILSQQNELQPPEQYRMQQRTIWQSQ